MKRFVKLFLILCVMLLILSSCNKADGDIDQSATPGQSGEPVPSDPAGDKPGASGNNSVVIATDHKIIYTVDYSLTCDDVNETIKTINSQIITIGGYISNSNQTDADYGRFVYRVPTEQLNSFLDFVDGLGNSSSKSISTKDVTSSYNELVSRLEVLEASRAAYLKLLQNENLTIDEMITIQNKIDYLDQDIKTAHKNLDSLNSSLDYSTVTITYYLKGVQPKNEFMRNYGSFLVSAGKTVGAVVLYSLPFAAVGGIIFGIIVLVRRKKKASEEDQEKQ